MIQILHLKKVPIMLFVSIILLQMCALPAYAQLRQKAAKKPGTPPPTETQSALQGDSKPILIKQDSIVLAAQRQKTADSLAALKSQPPVGKSQSPSDKTQPNKVLKAPAVKIVSHSANLPASFEREVPSKQSKRCCFLPGGKYVEIKAIYKVLTLNDEVIVMHADEKQMHKGGVIWTIDGFNSQFEKMWTKDVELQKNFNFYQSIAGDNVVHAVMLDQYSRGKKGGFSLMVLTIGPDGDISKFNGEVPVKYFSQLSLEIVGTHLFVKGALPNQEPSLMCGFIPITKRHIGEPVLAVADLNSPGSNIKMTQFPYKGDVEFGRIQYDSISDVLDAYIHVKENKKRNVPLTQAVIQFDKDGSIKSTVNLHSSPGFQFVNGTLSTTPEGDRFIVGIYSADKSKLKSARGCLGNSHDYATDNGTNVGFYMTRIVDGNQQNTQYIPFDKITNFFSFLNNKAEASTLKKSKKAKEQNKLLGFNYNAVMHRAVIFEDQVIYVGEIYYPHYHQECRTSADGKSTTCYTVFDGYVYANVFVISFDKAGNLLWTNTYPTKDYRTFDLHETMKEMVINGRLLLKNAHYGKITTLDITPDGHKSRNVKSVAAIDAAHSEKVDANAVDQDLTYWYDDYFIVSGFQKMKIEGSRKRKVVFFMNKTQED